MFSLLAAKQLWLAELKLRNDVEIVNEKSVEYEWGWVMHYRPTAPYSNESRRLDEYQFPFLIDRVTGATGSSGGTKGIQYGIVLLLQKRPEHLCGAYPYTRDDEWFVALPKYQHSGAFEPIQDKLGG